LGLPRSGVQAGKKNPPKAHDDGEKSVREHGLEGKPFCPFLKMRLRGSLLAKYFYFNI
jgi:hypothetical protein